MNAGYLCMALRHCERHLPVKILIDDKCIDLATLELRKEDYVLLVPKSDKIMGESATIVMDTFEEDIK